MLNQRMTSTPIVYLLMIGYSTGHVSSEGHSYVLTRSFQAHQPSLSPAFDDVTASATIDNDEYEEDREYGPSSDDYFGASERPGKKLGDLFKLEELRRPAANGKRKKSSPRHAAASVFEQGETKHFLQFLRRINYDHRQFPENGGESVEVGVSIVVSNIRAVSEVTMDYALELFYRESWMDTRLFFDKQMFANKSELTLHESYANFLWHPDTFMPNAIASKNPQKQSISHRSLLRLRENGLVLYSRRISIIAECPMDLTLFPFDSQTCKLGIESYGYTADQVHYKWLRGNIQALTLQKIRLPDFQIRRAYVTSQLESYATGNYSRLYVCFVFERASGFCFLQLIIPSTAIVITSWVALWMESETEFQDMISIILAITFLIFSYNEMMPRVSYLKALDVWLAVCFMTVFLSLIKLALVKYMRKKLRSGDLIPTVLCEVFNDGSATGNVSNSQRLSGDYYGNENDYSSEKNLLNPANVGRCSSEDDNGVPAISRRHSRVSLVNLRFNDTKLATQTTVINEKVVGSSKGRLIVSVIDSFSNFLSKRLRLTTYGMRQFHWISQMMFFFGFVTFALFYFLIYPSLHQSQTDNACRAENAETFAIIV